jgi:polysaccharide biosynthesis/export protein
MNPEKRYCNYHNSQMKLFIAGLILPFLLFSCVTQRNLEYMRDKNDTSSEYKEASFPVYQLKPNDALYIKISSLDDAASNVFTQPATTQALDAYGAYMSAYIVDKEGFVLLPVIGKINVLGKTTADVSEMIKDSVANILSLPTVTVRLVNQYVSVLGEVRAPGHFVFSQDKFTIFNAIGLAGDINEYGNRREVILIRNESGMNRKIRIDLTRADIVSSPYYFIQPNDLVYVSPLRKRFWGMREFPFAIIMTTITTAIVVYTFIIQQQQP